MMEKMENNRKETQEPCQRQGKTAAIRASRYSYEELIGMGIPEWDACRMRKIPYQPEQ